MADSKHFFSLMEAHKILIIDDETSLLELLVEGLDLPSCEIVTEQEAEGGWARIREGDVALALVDVDLPGTSGLELCRQLKHDPQFYRIPVVLMTGKETTRVKREGFEAGATDFINKPFDLEELRKRILALLPDSEIATTASNGTPSRQAPSQESLLKLWQGSESTGDPLFILNRDGSSLYQNQAFHRFFNVPESETLTAEQHRTMFSSPEDWEWMWKICLTGDYWQHEVELCLPNGTTHWMQCRADPIRDNQHQVQGIVLVYADISRQKRLEADLLAQAVRDPLTQLFNRRFFEEALHHAISGTRRGHVYSLLHLDLNDFKLVNDTFGHQAGDNLLIDFAQILSDQTRENDQLARLGGDEFVVLLDGTAIDGAIRAAERIHNALKAYKRFEAGEFITLTASIGLAALTGSETAQEALLRADIASYVAKTKGEEAYVTYDETNPDIQRFKHEASWSVRIDTALEEDRFELWAQPIIPLKGTSGPFYEVLLRAREKSGEIITPGSIIPSAERFGKIRVIDEHVAKKAIECLARHRNRSLTLAVNLSSRSLTKSRLPKLLEAELHQYQLKAHRLVFELTESAMIENIDLARSAILRLKAIGCRFALDDFGTGFSTLNHLRSLPLDFLKIDMGLVHGLESDPVKRSLLRSVNEIAQTLEKKTIAEGVETKEALKLVTQLGTNFAQGWHFSKAIPIDDAIQAGSTMFTV